MATHRRESLHAPGPAVRPGGEAEVGEGDREEPLKVQEEEDGGSRGGGGGFDEGGSTPHPRGVAPPSGVVQGGIDRPPPPARATLKRVTAEWAKLYSRVPPPGRHHPGHHRSICGGGWRPHGGGN